jgi:trehalose 6-phosphate phosphatase
MLRAFAQPRTLAAFDFDGTLAPIVPRPEDAAMRETTRERLVQVARRYPVVILTGRARTDMLRLLNGVPVLEVIGSHGLETAGTPTGRFSRLVAQWRAQVADRLKALAGVKIEDKRYSLSLHYRHADDEAEAREHIERAVADLPEARIVGGKKVVNVVPREAPDKGRALLASCRRLGCERSIYVGDDVTDEDVFRLRATAEVLGIRVGCSDASAAAYCLSDQEQIDALLDALVAAAQ